MLTKIREKAQGLVARVMFIMISVAFALWGIQNYLDTGKEEAIASVGKKDFYQRDVTRAYEQYSQQFRNMKIDEQILRKQALEKLIKDEVLLQYVNKQGLVITDASIREYVKGLPYFQVDGKFSEGQYKSFLASQRISSAEFVNRIRTALLMKQFEDSVIGSSFASDYDVESFFKIQNQQRDVEYLTIKPQQSAQAPKDEEIKAYYEQHKDSFQTPEQVSVEYVELLLADIAKSVKVTDENLKAFYEKDKTSYTTPERRKISHILFAVKDKKDEQAVLEKANKAKQDLTTKDFAKLAEEVSDDKLTAKKGGDLGLFNAGSMDKAFEEAASGLKLNEVSAPVRSAFGYHLIKVTELVPEAIKPFEAVKDELTKAYQKSQAEDIFYQSGEKLTEVAYESPDNLKAAADALKLEIKKSGLFSRNKGEGVGAEEKVRTAAFSEEVLQGNNSTPIEVSPERIVVVRVLDHKTASLRELKDVKAEISTVLLNEKAKQDAIDKAKKIKERLQAGETLQAVAAENKLEIKKVAGLTRSKTDVPQALNDAIFKAAKPVKDKPSIFTVALPADEQAVVSLTKVTPGVMTEEEKKKLELAKKNIANEFGGSEFNAVITSLRVKADVEINAKPQEKQ